jgi:poly [ADP-ribose] polymerase
MSETKSETPKIEPAKSSRSTCKECRQKIMKDKIRVGNPYQFNSPKGDVLTGFSWFHLECTPGYVIPEVINSLKESPLEDKDQQKEILSTLNRMFKDKPKMEAQEQKKADSPFLERAKSSRGKCRKCEEKIEKGEIRVAEPAMVELENGRKFSSHKYYHQKCFFDNIEDPKSSLTSIIKKSLAKKSINEDDEKEIENEFADLFQSDSKISDLLSLIGSEPIKIQLLRDKSHEEGINFKLVEKAIERGMIKGLYFNPIPDMIQKLE